MGNAELKSGFKESTKLISSANKLGLTPDILFEEDLIESVTKYIKETISVQEFDMAVAFPEGNHQVNENSKENYTSQFSSELSESLINGFVTSSGNIEILKEPAFQKYFTVSSSESAENYTTIQRNKFVILYTLFLEKFKEQQEKKLNFFEYIQRFLAKTDPTDHRIQVGLESGFKFSLALLKEIQSVNKDMLLNSLEYLYQTLRQAEAGSLYNTDKLSFMIDANLNDARQFLVSIIEDLKSEDRAIELAYKIILLIGVARSNIEDLLIVATLLDKQNAQIDLRQEIELLKGGEGSVSNHIALTNGELETNNRKILKKARLFFLVAGEHLQTVKNGASITTDGQHIYFYNTNNGIYKLGTGVQQGSMTGQIFQQVKNFRSGEKCGILYLNGKLLCRSEQIIKAGAPFIQLDSASLEEEVDSIQKNQNKMFYKGIATPELSPNLERELIHRQLFTDGEFIYIPTLRSTKTENPDQTNEEETPSEEQSQTKLLFIEVYDASQPDYPFVREVQITQCEDNEDKYQDTLKLHKRTCFATNGHVLYLRNSTLDHGYFYDIKTGQQITRLKLTNSDDIQAGRTAYDYQNNTFYHINFGSDAKLFTFSLSNFQKSGTSSGFQKDFQNSRLQSFKSHIYSEQYVASNANLSSSLNLIERIMQNVTAPILIQESREKSRDFQKIPLLPRIQRTLILGKIDSSCQALFTQIEASKSSGQTSQELENKLMSYFKSPNATYLTSTMFKLLQVSLDRNNVIISQKKTLMNLHDQYSFYFVLRILKANFEALNLCGITLADLLKLKESYDDFIDAYKQSVVRIIEKGYNQEFEEGPHVSEMQQLWEQIYQVCLQILSSSINLIYANHSEIIDNLTKSLSGAVNEKQAENCSISLNYLSQASVAASLFDPAQVDQSKVRHLIAQVQNHTSDHYKKLFTSQAINYLKVETFKDHQSNLTQSCIQFFKNICEQALIQYCSVSETIAQKAGSVYANQQSDKQKQASLENLLLHIIQTLSDSTGTIINEGIHSYFQCLKHQQENKDEKYLTAEFAEFIAQVLQFNTKNLSTVALYVQSFSLFKPNLKLTYQLQTSFGKILGEISQYFEVIKKHKDLISNETVCSLNKYLSYVARSTAWFLSMLAYKLIKVKEDVLPGQEDKQKPKDSAHDLLIQSDLLSGGLQPKHLNLLSADAQAQLNELIRITQEKSLITHLSTSSSQSVDEDEKLLNSIIHKGKNAEVDRVITYMQQLLERKVPMVPYARLGGEDGFRLTRAAFAVMQRFSNDGVERFMEFVDELDLTWSELEGDEDKDFKFKDAIKKHKAYEQIQKRYESASKMRQWVNEKKKNLMEKVRKQVETQYMKDKESKPAELVKAESDAVQIDTSTTKQETNSKDLNEADKEKIEELADAKFYQELYNIYDKIVEKADFLIKLAVPESYKIKDQLSNKIGGLLFIRDIQSMENIENQLGGASKFNWRDRMKQWKQVQTSKGAIKSFTDKRKEIFENSMTSILACLQTPITTQKIKKQVETVFLNATKRVAGLKIINNLIQCELPGSVRTDIIQWFSSSLRSNKNQLTHYLDDLKGCGEILDDLARTNFFAIIRSLVNQLKNTENELEAKIIINALKWKYTARDHGNLRGLDIFKLLHEGNSALKTNILKNCWGKNILNKIVQSEESKQLSQEVISLFEQIYLLTVGRIVSSNEGDSQIKIKSSGTSVPTLTKAQSIIDENVSEFLVAQSFEVIFKEIGRYIKIVKEFQGVDWVKYANLRNKDLKENKEIQAYLDEFKIEGEIIEESNGVNVNEQINEDEDEIAHQEKVRKFQKSVVSALELYSEKFLARLLRLIDIFTSIATTKQHPLQMIQRVATPYYVESLLNLIVYSSPRNKITAIKIIDNLIKIQLPFEILEETINIFTRDPNSLPSKIYNHTNPKAELKESQFLRFIYNYILGSRHKMWHRQGIESEGQYAVAQELINLLRSIYENAPQEDLQNSLREKMRRFLTQPVSKWNIEEADVLLSILPSGDFTRLMLGSHAIYKDTQKCIVIGFSEQASAEQDLGILTDTILENFKVTNYCQDPAKQKALFLFVGDDSSDSTFIPEVRALEVGDLLPVGHGSSSPNKLSILYEDDILKNFIDILSQDLTDQSTLVLRQAQIQILKAITHLVDAEHKENNQSDFLKSLSQKGHLSHLFKFLQRNANRPQIQNKGESNLPNELLEIHLTSLRIKAMESNGSILSSSDLKVHIGNEQVSFFIPQQKGLDGKLIPSVFRNFYIEASINKTAIPKSHQNKTYPTVSYSYLIQSPDNLNQFFEGLIIDKDVFDKQEDDNILQALQIAKIVIINDSVDIEKVYYTLKQWSTKHHQRLAKPLHHIPIIQVTHADLLSISQQPEAPREGVVFSESRLEQYNKFVDDLVDWGSFQDAKISKIKEESKGDDKSIESILKLKKKIQGQKDVQSESNIKKLLVGRMASLSRKQASSVENQVFEDIGSKVWEESFAASNIHDVFDKLKNSQENENLESTVRADRLKAFGSAFNTKKVDDDGIYNKYVQTLNKLLRLKSRTTLVKLLEYLDPLPAVELRGFDSLDKLLLLSYNEALNIKNLTGDKTFLRQVKSLLKRMIQDFNLRDFIFSFMATNIIKPTSQVINKIINDKEFLVGEVFESEVDSQIYPLPTFISSIMKLILKFYPELFSEIRGLLPNAVSLLFALSLARSVKDTKFCNQQIKLLTTAARLLTWVRAEKSNHHTLILQDVSAMKIISLFNDKHSNKFTYSKSKEQVKIFKEVIYEWEQIFAIQKTIDSTKVVQYDPRNQSDNFAKRINFLKTKDPILFFQLFKNITGSLQAVQEKINNQVKILSSHPSEVRVPFISKVKSLNGASAMNIKRLVTDQPADDRYTFHYDQLGKVAEQPATTEFEKRVDHLYLSYQKQQSDNLFYFGFAKKGRLNGTYQEEIYKEVETYPNFAWPIKQIASSKNGTIILRDDGFVIHTGNVGGVGVSGPYEERTYWENTICCVTAGKRNIAFATTKNIVCFLGGTKNNHYSTGSYETSNFYKAKFHDALEADDRIIDISSGNHFTMLVSQKGHLMGSGDFFMDMFFQKPHDGEAGFKKVPLPEGQKPLGVYACRDKLSKCILVDIQEGSKRYLQSIGTHFSGVLGVGEQDYLKDLKTLDYDYENITFVKVSMHTNHAMAITDKGHLYGWGSNLGFRLGLPQDQPIVNKPTLIPFFSDSSLIKVLDIACGDDHSLVQVEELDDVTNTWQLKLYQVGYNQDEAGSTFRGVSKEKLEEAYVHNQGIVRIERFDNQKVKAMGCGHQTSFVYLVDGDTAKDTKLVNKIVKNEILPQIYKRGYLHLYIDAKNHQDNLPMLPSEEELSKDNIEDLQHQQINRASSLSHQEEEKKEDETPEQKQDKEAKRLKLLEEKKAQREKKREAILQRRKILEEKNPAKEGWHFHTNDELSENTRHTFPRVTLAIRHSVNQLYQNLAHFKTVFEQASQAVEDKPSSKFTEQTQHGVLCSETGLPIVGTSRYYASYMVGEELKEVHLSEEAFREPTEVDHMPLVYFRLTHHLKPEAKLPVVDLKEIHKETGLKFTIEVRCQKQFFSNRQALADMFKEVQDNDMLKKNFLSILKSSETGFEKQVSQFLSELNECTIKDLDKELWDKRKDILKYFKDGKNDELTEEHKTICNSLKKFTTEENYSQVQQTFFNILFQLQIGKKVLTRISERNLKGCHPESLPFLRKNLILGMAGYMKNEILNTLIQALPTGERHEVTVRRRKAAAFADTGAVDHEGVHTIFGQIMQSLKKGQKARECFRVNTVDSQILKVEFKGEGSIDAGGPYRETLTNLCNEWQSAVLPLLIPTPNNKNNHGQFRECWMVNPSSTSPSHLEMFKHFGYFIGAAIRSQQALPLDLAPIFWKVLIDETDTESDADREMTLKAFDTYSWQVIEDLRVNAKGLSEEDFEAAIDEYFVTLLSNGTQVELLPGGRSIKVTKQNLDEYIRLVVSARINESQKQMRAIKDGVNFVININICKFLNAKQIETRATGSKTLDIALLKKISVYEGASLSESHIQIFWQVMESFNDEEKSLYLKFVWGRARLPATTDQKHKIVSMTYVANACLPVSHTCFFTLDMPRYPTFEIARDRIYFAIRFCGDIDADRSSHDIGSDD